MKKKYGPGAGAYGSTVTITGPIRIKYDMPRKMKKKKKKVDQLACQILGNALRDVYGNKD